MDAGVFFTMLFGSDRFEPYTGTLALAAAASMEGQISIRRMQAMQPRAQQLYTPTKPCAQGCTYPCTPRWAQPCTRPCSQRHAQSYTHPFIN
eukprot:6173394-Pleurochrysis_carterae.AAC.3